MGSSQSLEVQGYVLGFYVTPLGAVLIRKSQGWCKDRWNGIGGKIEALECPVQAMVREFKEETGVITGYEDWTALLTLRGQNERQAWTIFTFGAHTESEEMFAHLPREVDEGSVEVVSHFATADECDGTAQWLLAMWRDMRRHQISVDRGVY